jgi:hypothetical protein
MSNATDKLARLANFGNSAGSKPAAAAVAKAPVNSEKPALAPRKNETSTPDLVEKGQKPGQARPTLIRNVAFTADDQRHLDRVTDLLIEAGVYRPSISDVVRVALRGSATLKASSALQMLEESRKLDGRRKMLK